MWLRIFEHLLPQARAWQLTIDKNLRRIFQGLSGLGSDAKEYIDQVWLDLDPEHTRQLTEWENQFGLRELILTEKDRRARLRAAWQALGGQSPRYIQDTLQAAEFPVYVHEWWYLPVKHPGPVARNPKNYLYDGTNAVVYIMSDGAADSQDGDALAYDGRFITPRGYVLTNADQQLITFVWSMADGVVDAQDGDPAASDGRIITSTGRLVYDEEQVLIPSDKSKHPYFLYIGGENFPNRAQVPATRREELETLCLKICPTEQWLGMLIDYVETN